MRSLLNDAAADEAMVNEIADRLAADPRFEIAAPHTMSVICFRLCGEDEANRKLLTDINADGRYFLSHTVLNGRYVLRIAVGNLLTTRETLNGLWKLIDRLV